jgi:SPP1 family predicted phage head-tail adaptor
MKPKAEVMKDLAKVRRRLITIEKRTLAFDAERNQVELWAPWKTLKAEKTQLYGSEYYAAAAQGEEQTVVFTVRKLDCLTEVNTTDFRLTYDGRAYDIKQVDQLQDGGLWAKIKAIARPSDTDPGQSLIDHELVQGLKALVEDMLANVAMDAETQTHYQDTLDDTLEGW